MEEIFIRQLDDLLKQYGALDPTSKDYELANATEHDLVSFVTRAIAAVERMTRPQLTYQQRVDRIMDLPNPWSRRAPLICGVIDALQKNVFSGYMKSQEEIIHGELFADFLEMARHLLDEGYKDAAAVIAGSALEAHLRQLSQKHEIEANIKKEKSVYPKKAGQLNADLAKKNVYSKLDEKQVTAWLDLRNKAAHGKYDEYVKDQVALLIDGVRDFIARNPA
jgi:hypothetical protein